MTSKEAFKKIDWLIGQNISKLKFDKKCNSTNEMVSCLLIIEKDLEALVVLKDLFDFDFALRFPSNQPMLKITNKRTNEYWEISITQEEFKLLKKVLRND